MSNERPSKKSPAVPTRKPAARPQPEHQERLEQRRRMLAARQRRMTLLGVGSVVGFVLVVGTVSLVMWHNGVQREAERAAWLQHMAELKAELLPTEALTPSRAAALQQRIEATRAEWEKGPDADSLSRQAEQVKILVATEKARQGVAAEISALQAGAKATGTDLATWANLTERATALQTKVAKEPAEVRAEVDAAVETVVAGRFDALQRAASATGTEPRAALEHLQTADDLAELRLEALKKTPAAQAAWRERLKALVPAFDAAAKSVFTQAAVEAVALQDLRAPAANWVASKAENVVSKPAPDGIDIECKSDHGGKSGVLVLRHEQWHAVSLSFDVELASGTAVLFARTNTQMSDRGAGGLVLTTNPTDKPDQVTVPAGQPVHVDLTVVGDAVMATVGTSTPKQVELRVGNQERRGSFAAIVRPDSKLGIHHLKVRRLG